MYCFIDERLAAPESKAQFDGRMALMIEDIYYNVSDMKDVPGSVSRIRTRAREISRCLRDMVAESNTSTSIDV